MTSTMTPSNGEEFLPFTPMRAKPKRLLPAIGSSFKGLVLVGATASNRHGHRKVLCRHCGLRIPSAGPRIESRNIPEDYLSTLEGKLWPVCCRMLCCRSCSRACEECARHLSGSGWNWALPFSPWHLLDLRGDERMGKPRGADAHEGKMTLPLIHALTLSHGIHRERLSQVIEQFCDDDFDELMSLLERSDSLEYAEILVRTHLERAQAELDHSRQ